MAVRQDSDPATGRRCRVHGRERALVPSRRSLDSFAHVFLGLLLCLTIIGIPLGLGNFKLAAVTIAPLGKEIVSTNDPRAALGARVPVR